MLFMVQSLLQSGAVHLSGTHLSAFIVTRVAAPHLLLRPHRSGDHDRPRDLADPQITDNRTSRTIRHPTGATTGTWTPFIKALKTLYPVNKMSRFPNDNAFWKQWIDEVNYDLQVVPETSARNIRPRSLRWITCTK